MINLFQAASDDKSLEYLRQIFGSMNGIIYNPASSTATPETTISLLGTMFRSFNSVILTVGILIVIYSTVIGVMLTAHEGEFMGKKWNNLWLPIRTVLGIAALVPTASGYCALQLIMMWVIIQGIGAADRLWTTTLEYVDLVGSPYGKVTLPSSGAVSALTTMFNGFLCQATFGKTVNTNQLDSVDTRYFCATNPYSCTPSAAPPRNEGASSFEMGPSGICGKVSYCNVVDLCNKANDTTQTPDKQRESKLACQACAAQLDALWNVNGGGIINVLYAIADKVANDDYTYQKFYAYSGLQSAGPGGGGQQQQIPGDTQFITSYCADKVQGPCCVEPKGAAAAQQLAGGSAASAPKGKKCSPASSFPSPTSTKYGIQSVDEVQGGDLYWNYVIKPTYGADNFIKTSADKYISSITNAVTSYITEQGKDPSKLQQDLAAAQKIGWIFAGSYYYTIAQKTGNNLANAIPTLSVTPPDTQSRSFTSYRNNYQTAGSIIKAMANETSSTFRDTPQLSPFQGPINATFGTITDAFKTTTDPSNGTDAVGQVETAGRVMLLTVEVLYPGILALTVVLGLLGCFDVFILGNSVTDPICGTLTLTYFILIPGLFALMGYMITIGGLLGIYVPLIPYIIFSFGAIGWIISTVEAMVAGPLVALGILSPSGEHEILGKAQPALLLLFNLFLRPSLMIFGLMASIFLANVVVSFINYAFWSTVAQSLLVYDPLGVIIFLSAYVMLIVAALNKAFQAISIVPERVMAWISGQGTQYGEAEALQEAKGGVTSATAGARGAGEALRGKAEGAVAAQRKDQYEREKPANRPTVKPGGGTET